jgi:para-aminobenzoate synthetase/4-amino-4-deoxychorismate lyase
MKGTIQRGRWPDEDKAYAQALANSAKDKAENVMIVDLLRNDLGKVSVTGSVHVPRLFDLERFETLWQMTSTIESKLKPGKTLVDLIRAVFPCGSITGAPKIRTMEIIRELEPHPRGIYTGTIGLIRPGGDCTFNVAIRTIVLDSGSGRATFGVGGGITIDSTAEREYEECLVKSTFLRSRPAEFNLFESLLLEQGQYFLLEKHLGRLTCSADFFSFECNAYDIRNSLSEVAQSNLNGAWKVKIELERSGQFKIDAQPISIENQIKRVALASNAVDSSNRFLFHKTTQRDFYSSELARRPDCDDIIFWNARGEITESSIANVVLAIKDKLFTPPVASGLLAGTFREALLEDGQINERVVTIEELREATEFFLINSVRKWMPAELKSVP